METTIISITTEDIHRTIWWIFWKWTN